MFLAIGAVGVLACVIGSFVAMGGHLEVLFQPFELVIIGGAALCALIIASPKHVIGKVFGGFGRAAKGPKYKKADYLELITLLYQVFKLAKTKGMLSLEQHVEKPDESSLFAQFTRFNKDHHARTFLCDYLRLLTLGTDNAHEVEALMEEELETHHAEEHTVQHGLQNMADGLPALGIVAAVMGVIKTMGAIDQPPEVLGHLIGAALVGTFLGVLLSYGFVGPIASALKTTQAADAKYLECVKAGLLAHMQGYAPQVSVEFARKALLSNVRPSFQEIEDALNALPAPAA